METLVRNTQTGKLEWVDKNQADRLPSSRPRFAQTFTDAKPFTSITGACQPWQVKDFNEFIEKHDLGGSIRHLEDGTLWCTSKSALKAYLEARGMYDHNE